MQILKMPWDEKPISIMKFLKWPASSSTCQMHLVIFTNKQMHHVKAQNSLQWMYHLNQVLGNLWACYAQLQLMLCASLVQCQQCLKVCSAWNWPRAAATMGINQHRPGWLGGGIAVAYRDFIPLAWWVCVPSAGQVVHQQNPNPISQSQFVRVVLDMVLRLPRLFRELQQPCRGYLVWSPSKFHSPQTTMGLS